MNYRDVTPSTPIADLLKLIDSPAPTQSDRWPLGFHKWENVQNAYRRLLHQASLGSGILRPSSPQTHEKRGIGVVIYGGGKFSASTYITIRAIRHVGYSGPVELFYLDESEVDDFHRDLFLRYGVTLRNASECNDTRRIFNGWHLKPFALRHSRFRQLYAFDADCYPAGRNVISLLRKESVKIPTAIFLKDPPQFATTNKRWRELGIERQNIPGFESGFMAMDTVDCWRELELTQWINDHSDYYYQQFWGDKETFSLAWNYLGTPYYQPPKWYCMVGHALLHYWHDNLSLVVHRTEDKFVVTDKGKDTFITRQASRRNVFTPQLPLEFECWQWLKEYRESVIRSNVKTSASLV